MRGYYVSCLCIKYKMELQNCMKINFFFITRSLRWSWLKNKKKKISLQKTSTHSYAEILFYVMHFVVVFMKEKKNL